MTPREVLNRIRNLNIPRQAKEQLLLLCTRARKLVVGILRFIERHKQFAEAMILGAIIAYLLAHIPWIGNFLALCALITAAAVGVLKALREDIASLFQPIV